MSNDIKFFVLVVHIRDLSDAWWDFCGPVACNIQLCYRTWENKKTTRWNGSAPKRTIKGESYGTAPRNRAAHKKN